MPPGLDQARFRPEIQPDSRDWSKQVSENSVQDQQNIARWRIEMLARNRGFPIDLELDDFGF